MSRKCTLLNQPYIHLELPSNQEVNLSRTFLPSTISREGVLSNLDRLGGPSLAAIRGSQTVRSRVHQRQRLAEVWVRTAKLNRQVAPGVAVHDSAGV